MAADPGALDRLRLSIENRKDELVRLREAISAFARQQALPPAVVQVVELVLEEMITNVIKHAFEDSGPHTIDVEVAVAGGKVIVRIEDDGRPFDPLALPPPDTAIPIEERPIGGLGIHLVRNVAQTMTYQRAGGKNRLEIHIGLAIGQVPYTPPRASPSEP